ncbi:MAG: hypothetical protein ACKV2Q_06135 [Planctomycetaceae bacterium]
MSVLSWEPAAPEEDIDFQSPSHLRQLFRIRPSAQDAACSWGALVLGDNIDWCEARWHNRLYLEPLLEEVVRIAIARSLRGNSKSMPKDMHALIELLKELVVETKTGVDEDAREFLQQIVGSSKLGKAAKAIVSFAMAFEKIRELMTYSYETRWVEEDRKGYRALTESCDSVVT